MDQNNNLFDFGNQSPQEPQPPQEPTPPVPASDEPTPLSSGAQVYDVPSSQPPVEQPPYAYTPPPPPYTPPPPTAQAPRNNRMIWIIVVVVVLLLCCCCLALAGVWLYNNGDNLIRDINSGSFLPSILQLI